MRVYMTRAEPTPRAARRLLFVGLMLVILIGGSSTSTATPAMQEEEPRGTPLSYDYHVLRFFGEQDNSKTPDQWDTWNHAAATDPESDSDFTEINGPGQANNGGGNRVFTFTGSAPVNEVTLINDQVPFYVNITLAIYCNNDPCNEQLRITLMVGQNSLVSQSMQAPNDDGVYEFVLNTNLDRLDPGEAIGLKIEFTKPSGIVNEGYSLDLGNGNFEIEVPVLPPEEVIVPPGQGGVPGTYTSPYANTSNQFTDRDVPKAGLITPIVWGALSLILVIPAGMFIPNFGIFKPIGIALLSVGLMISLSVVPLIAYMETPAETEIGSVGAADYTTPDLLASLDASPGEFLAGITPGTEMNLYITYDRIYTSTVEAITSDNGQAAPTSASVVGLGFEDYSEVLGDNTTSTLRGSERLQLYFSLLFLDGIDLQSGHAVIINATFVERCEGCAEVVPQWASHIDDETPAEGVVVGMMPGDFSPRYIVPASAVTVINVEPSWGMMPLLGFLPMAIAAFGIGGYQYKTARDMWLMEQYEDEDIDDFDDDDDFDDGFE